MGIGERIREERERLGLSQADFAALAGAHRKSQGNYESGDRYPDAAYLAAIAEAGADVGYIVTGKRDGPPRAVLKAEEQLLVERYRASPPPLRDAALRVLLGGDPGGQAQHVKKNTGQMTQVGDITVGKGKRK